MITNSSFSTVDALRVQIEGVTASFRYPHFLIGRQPSYPLPPPSTIYGLIAGTLGDLPLPDSIQFAYTFRCEKERTDDLEKIWFIQPQETKELASVYPTEAKSNVLPREWIIKPRLTLYLIGKNLDDLYQAFRCPRYAPVLGRSQDLVSYRKVEKVQLIASTRGVFEAGLLSKALRDSIRIGVSIHLPRFIDPLHRWSVTWDWFVVLNQSVEYTVDADDCLGAIIWADPEVNPAGNDLPRLLNFHPFTSNV